MVKIQGHELLSFTCTGSFTALLGWCMPRFGPVWSSFTPFSLIFGFLGQPHDIYGLSLNSCSPALASLV